MDLSETILNAISAVMAGWNAGFYFEDTISPLTNYLESVLKV